MTWNYRIVQYADNSGFGLHEVYYDQDGQPEAMTETPVGFSVDPNEGPEALKDSLAKAFADACVRSILREPKHWRPAISA